MDYQNSPASPRRGLLNTFCLRQSEKGIPDETALSVYLLHLFSFLILIT